MKLEITMHMCIRALAEESEGTLLCVLPEPRCSIVCHLTYMDVVRESSCAHETVTSGQSVQ